VRPDDYVVTASVETGLAEYLIIGRVAEVSRRPTDLVYTIVVRPQVDLDRLERVYVLAPQGAPPAKGGK
jgi:cell shape-determining protein MreC